MGAAKQHGTTEARLDRLRRRIQTWRGSDPKRRAMPAEIWAEATDLARRLGVNPVRRAVAIDYAALKRRVESRGGEEAGSAETSSAFVELPRAARDASAQGPVIELSDGHGSLLTLRLGVGAAIDVAEVMALFRRGRR